MTGTVFDIQRFCVHDGPGIRTTVFMKGCPLRCRWCHNPEGLRREPQVQFFDEECIRCGSCSGERLLEDTLLCPTGALKLSGKEYETLSLLDAVLADRDFYDSDGGVTFSGGECLLQADFVSEVLEAVKGQGITTAIDTCGAVPWESIEKTLPFCDTYLYDIKCADPVLHREYTGLTNDRILENLQRLSDAGAAIWIRVPVIPNFNDNETEMEAIAKIAASAKGVQKVTLIPYHTLGKSKYKTLGMVPGYETDKSITNTRLSEFAQVFRNLALTVD